MKVSECRIDSWGYDVPLSVLVCEFMPPVRSVEEYDDSEDQLYRNEGSGVYCRSCTVVVSQSLDRDSARDPTSPVINHQSIQH